MKKLIIAGIFLGFLLIIFGCAAPAPTRDGRWVSETKNVNLLQNATVMLVKKQTPDEPNCTGFFVKSDIIATALHCVQESETIKVEILPGFFIEIDNPDYRPAIGNTIQYVTNEHYNMFLQRSTENEQIVTNRAIVIAVDKINDIAIMKTDDEFKSKNILNLTDVIPTSGERVYAMGMPAKQTWILTEGIISSVENLPFNLLRFIHEAPITFGSSGSPLINDFGQVIGVNVAFYRNAEYLTVAIPSNNLIKLIKQIK